MSKIIEFADELIIINPSLIVSNLQENGKLALIISPNQLEYGTLVSFNGFHHCYIEETFNAEIKNNIRLAAKKSGFEVFER